MRGCKDDCQVPGLSCSNLPECPLSSKDFSSVSLDPELESQFVENVLKSLKSILCS